MLTLDSVTAGYGDTTVLRGVDFTVGDGEVIALLGPNGAGKTTLLRTATGFVRPLSRAYLTNPKIILVDEPSLGLAPRIIDQIYEILAQFVARGISLVIVEQYVQRALALANKVYILSRGEVIHVGKADELDQDQIYQRYLGIES